MITGQAELKDSNWGRVIDLSEIGIDLPNKRTMAFLRYSGNCRDFTVGEQYLIKIHFLVTYFRIKLKPGESDQWVSFREESYEAAVANSEFLRMNLKEEKIVPYFEIYGKA